jgi:hypothetical protein
MFGRKRDAMRVADGALPRDVLDAMGPADKAEAAAFADLATRVRAAEEARSRAAGIPDFEAMFAGVEARVEAERRAAARTERTGWLAGLVGSRPLWVLAPAGAMIMALALGWVLMSGGEARPDNTCFVDSYDADKGSIFVDQDPDDPAQATVIWVVDEEEG